MDVLLDLTKLLFAFIAKLYDDSVAFYQTLAIALFLGTFTWILCSYSSSRLWNTKFQLTIKHHLICLLASFCTFLIVFVFVSLQYTDDVATSLVTQWQRRINDDQPWQRQTFDNIYNEIKALNTEDFTSFPPPREGGHIIPATHNETKKQIATQFANEAVNHFNQHHPFLSKFLWATSKIPGSAINEDQKKYFQENPGKPYLASKAINLAAMHIKQDLFRQIPGFIKVIKIFVGIIFILILSIPFGLIGYCAYNELKITT